MSISELIFGTGYSLFAFFAAIGIVLFFAALLHVEQHFGHWAQPALIPIIALGICASSLLSGRSLQNAVIRSEVVVAGIPWKIFYSNIIRHINYMLFY